MRESARGLPTDIQHCRSSRGSPIVLYRIVTYRNIHMRQGYEAEWDCQVPAQLTYQKMADTVIEDRMYEGQKNTFNFPQEDRGLALKPSPAAVTI